MERARLTIGLSILLEELFGSPLLYSSNRLSSSRDTNLFIRYLFHP